MLRNTIDIFTCLQQCTVDSPYKILVGTEDFGNILYHLYEKLDGNMSPEVDFVAETMIWDPQEKCVIGQSILYRSVS